METRNLIAKNILLKMEKRLRTLYVEDKIGDTAYSTSLIRIQTALLVVNWLESDQTVRKLGEMLSLPDMFDDIFV